MTQFDTARNVLLVSSLALLGACSSGSDAASGPADPVTGGPGTGGATLSTETLDALFLDADGIVDLDATVDPAFTDVFARYTAVERAGLAGRIHVLAQSSVSDAALVRARTVLEHTLTDVPGTPEGADKSDVFAAMVAEGAVLAVFADDASADRALPAVDAVVSGLAHRIELLTADRIVREGTPEYMAALPALDRSFGAAAALVLRTGIETARPTLAAELADLAADDVAAGRFVAPAGTRDSEIPGLYLALAADVHAGVFGHDPDGDGVARAGGAELVGIDRDDLSAGSPGLWSWLDEFLAEGHAFAVTLPADFTGNFDCLRRSWNPYSARSQHLREIHLSGSGTAEIFGAPFDVVLVGNDGNNNLKGRRGFDRIVGGLGFDTAVFSGPQADYDVRFEDGHWVVEDVFGGHEQTDVLDGIERVQFTDGGWNL
ncbi:MAG: hypothetical protein AAFR54_17585 [Planctomycetota bacterium]